MSLLRSRNGPRTRIHASTKDHLSRSQTRQCARVSFSEKLKSLRWQLAEPMIHCPSVLTHFRSLSLCFFSLQRFCRSHSYFRFRFGSAAGREISLRDERERRHGRLPRTRSVVSAARHSLSDAEWGNKSNRRGESGTAVGRTGWTHRASEGAERPTGGRGTLRHHTRGREHPLSHSRARFPNLSMFAAHSRAV